MNKLNENIFHQYNKWKTGYVRKENSIKFKLNDFLDRHSKYKDTFSISEDGKCVNCSGSVFISDEDLIDGKLPFPFGKVKGTFKCSCGEIISLEGAPKEVGGSFWTYSCPNLISLKGAPEKVGNNFNCDDCPNLTSLEGAPKEVGGDFSCIRCTSLTSLEYLPKEINGDLVVNKRFKGEVPSDIKVSRIIYTA